MISAFEPFYVETATHRLFACYHEAQAWPPRETGFVFCQPQGQEYLRSHRAFERLAGMLAQQGFPVLRFDYSGSGDSTGDDEEGTLVAWRDEIARMCDELAMRSGVATVGLIGMRLGATLALEVASTGAFDPAALVLWEPVIHGMNYLEGQEQRFHETSLRYAISVTETPRTDGSRAVNGFVLGSDMVSQLNALDLERQAVQTWSPTLIIESNVEANVQKFAQSLQQRSPHVAHRQVESFVVWTEDVDKGLVPMRVLTEIVAWINETFPA